MTFGERSELGDQVFCERLDVALRDGAEKHELQEFVIAHRFGAGLPEAVAQPFPVAVIVRWRLGKASRPARFGNLVRHE